MKAKSVRYLIALAVIVFVTIPSPVALGKPQTVFVVLANRNATHNFSRGDFVRILRGDVRFWVNRKPIRIILPPRTSADAFGSVLKLLLKLSLADYQQMWEGRRFRGEATILPVVAPDERSAARAVVTDASFLAIIDFERLADIPTAVRGSLQVVTIDGRGPDEDGYLLTAAAAD